MVARRPPTTLRRATRAAVELVSELHVKSRSELARYLARRINDRALIDDLAQEVFLRLLKLDRVHLIRNPRAYLFRVAASVIADYGRRRSRRPHTESWAPEDTQFVDGEPGPFERCHWSQRIDRIQTIINDLPERCRRALILQRRDGWTYDEIALELGVSRSMVKKYLRKALILCRRALDEQQPASELME